MKEISVAILGTAGVDEPQDLEIESGTTAADVLAALDLEGYRLLPEPDAAPFGNDESIYSKVEEGQKLFAVSDARVGT